MTVPKFVVANDDGEELVSESIEFDEVEEKIEAPKAKRPVRQDPKPAVKRPVGRPPKSDLEREAKEELEIMFAMIAGVWVKVDPDCAIVFNQQSDAIAKAIAHKLAQNPKLLERVKNWSGLGGWAPIFFATAPVLQQIAKHHIIKQENTDGQPQTA